MLTNTTITNIHSQEEMDKVADVLVKLGNIVDGTTNYDNGDFPVIIIYSDGKFMSCLDNNRGYHPITTSEFFAKYDTPVKTVDKPKFKVGDRVKSTYESIRGWLGTIISKGEMVRSGQCWIVDYDNGSEFLGSVKNGKFNESWEGFLELVEEPQPLKNTNNNNNPSEPCVGKEKTKNMSIVNFFNDLTVSADDKELRKAGLLDNDLGVTNQACEVIKNLEAKERGYKNWSDLTDKIYKADIGLTPLEAETLYKKFYAKLLETAKKYNRKDEKKYKK